MSWSAYYASLQPTHGVSESSLTNTPLLALFLDSVAMIRNPMNIVKANFLTYPKSVSYVISTLQEPF